MRIIEIREDCERTGSNYLPGERRSRTDSTLLVVLLLGWMGGLMERVQPALDREGDLGTGPTTNE